MVRFRFVLHYRKGSPGVTTLRFDHLEDAVRWLNSAIRATPGAVFGFVGEVGA